MDFMKFACVLLVMVTCSYASPVLSTEKSIPTAPSKPIGLSTVKRALSTTTAQPAIVRVKVLPYKPVEIKTIKENSRTDTLYQMTTSLLQKEKNWLQTEKWLIDNVYRLKNELGDIKRELSDQKKLNSILSQKSNPQMQIISNDQARSNFVQDLSALRADHRLINQQQQQLVQLSKDSQQQIQSQSDLIRQWIAIIKEQYKVEQASKPTISFKKINDSTNVKNFNFSSRPTK